MPTGKRARAEKSSGGPTDGRQRRKAARGQHEYENIGPEYSKQTDYKMFKFNIHKSGFKYIISREVFFNNEITIRETGITIFALEYSYWVDTTKV